MTGGSSISAYYIACLDVDQGPDRRLVEAKFATASIRFSAPGSAGDIVLRILNSWPSNIAPPPSRRKRCRDGKRFRTAAAGITRYKIYSRKMGAVFPCTEISDVLHASRISIKYSLMPLYLCMRIYMLWYLNSLWAYYHTMIRANILCGTFGSHFFI
jgi:hypothetical protein